MFADDIDLVAEMTKRYEAVAPFVEVGGLEYPIIADYDRTIEAMKALRERGNVTTAEITAAQELRYLQIHRPLETWCPGYICEDPAHGGVAIERLADKYPDGSLGTLIALSTLEHVADPWAAVTHVRRALRSGGLCIVSVPWTFPYHPSPEDHWRFSPSGLRLLFSRGGWHLLDHGWRLRIPAHAGVFDLKTGAPQAVESCFLVARAA